MCDSTLVTVSLAAGTTAIVVTGVSVGVAALASASFFGAGAAVPAIIAAGVAAAVGSGAFATALGAVTDYARCVRQERGLPLDACNAELIAFQVSGSGLVIGLGAISTACLGSAPVAWIPGVAAGAAVALTFGLVASAASAVGLAASFVALESCLRQHAATGTAVGPITEAPRRRRPLDLVAALPMFTVQTAIRHRVADWLLTTFVAAVEENAEKPAKPTMVDGAAQAAH